MFSRFSDFIHYLLNTFISFYNSHFPLLSSFLLAIFGLFFIASLIFAFFIIKDLILNFFNWLLILIGVKKYEI